jgi:hypothetical protein
MALEENDFSKLFLSAYKKEWEKTDNYALIRRQTIRSNFFLPLSNIDAHILPKYMNLTLSNIEDGVSLKEKLRTALYPLS